MKRSTLVLWALAAALVCWRLDPLGRPITGDNQLYFFLAERAASGVPPHVSHVDPKHQLGVLATAGAIAAGRVAGVDDVAASRVVSIAAASAAVALAAESAARLAGTAVAGHVAAAALLATRGFAHHATVGSNPKVFLAVFVLLAQAAISRGPGSRRDAISGSAAGAAFLCWQPALLVVAAVVLEAAWGSGGSRARAARVLAWALLPVFAYEAYFLLCGALGEQLRQTWLMTRGSVHEPPHAWRSLRFVFGEGARGFRPRAGPLCLAMLAGAALAALLRSPLPALARWRSRPGAVAFAAGAAGAVAFTLYDHQGVPDLFFPAPSFAIAAGVVAAAAARALAKRTPRLSAPLVVAAMAAVFACQLRCDEALRREPAWNLASQRRIAQALREEHEAGRRVWAYGAVHLLALAHLDNHVPYGLFFDDVASVLDVERYVPVRDGRLPDLIVQGRRRFPDDAPYLRERYDAATTAMFAEQGLRLWRLREPAHPRRSPGAR